MNTRLKMMPRNRRQYATGEAFKKELELNLWCHLDDSLWLHIKPNKELPWDGADMEKALNRVLSY